MAEWLPEDWLEDAMEESAERVEGTVRGRIARSHRLARASRWTLVAAACAAALALLAPRLDHLGTRKDPGAQVSETVTLAKAPGGVALTWRGDPHKKYTVYRCTSPRFDACTTAGAVTGTRWVDTAPAAGRVVYYKVEPAAKS